VTSSPRASARLLALATALLLLGCEGRGGAPLRAAGSVVASAAPAYRCGVPLPADAAGVDDLLATGYADWKRRYLTADGAGGFLRVRMPDDGDKSSSEGIGYGMLLSAYLGDRSTLDALWKYAGRFRNASGLMSWEVSRAGRVTDRNAATDADEDMAFALLVADARWGGYGDDASSLIGSLMRHGVEPGSFVFKPGDGWGGSAVTNPSYFAPAYYRAFAAQTGDRRWERVVESSYAILDRVAARHAGATGLQPEWATAAGDSAPGAPSPSDDGYEFHYGYGAARVPWRLAMDAAWSCDPRARRHLERLNAFFQRIGPAEIVDGYRLNGERLGGWHSEAFVAPLAAAALFSADPAYRAAIWREAVELRQHEYYPDSLRLLALLLASGRMQPPPPRPVAGGG
jgi:endo-1,4-beta-D-glucanase Y